MIFNESMNTQAYLKAGIMGFAGSGKTFTAKEIAIGLHKILKARKLPGGEQPVNFLDTETGSDWIKPHFTAAGIKLFSGKTRAFSDLVPAIREAEKGRGILIIDSITHFWRELTQSYAKKKHRTNGLRFDDWAYLKLAWGDFTDAFVNSNCHIIMCGRAGYEYDFFQDEETGKKELEKTGIKMKAETETGYEPSILILMERHQDISTDPIRVFRTAIVLKDRADLLDGARFVNPTFDDFKPHVDFLNLGGEQLGVDTGRTSEASIPGNNNEWKYEQQQREITLDEIQSLLVKHFPGQSAADKKAKGDLLEKHFDGIRSWKRIETLPLLDLRTYYNALHLDLEGKPADFTAPSTEELPDFSADDEELSQQTIPLGEGKSSVGVRTMYSGTVKQADLDFAGLQSKVPDLKPQELVIGNGVATVRKLPFTAPWLSPYGACLIRITDIKRADDGDLLFQLADESSMPYDNGTAWCKADRFFEEWPQ